jgi:hypothetical protein
VFEYWLHPTRYRTQLCNDGSNCRRKICFFAHSLDELRVPACKPFVSPEALAAAAAAAAAASASDAGGKRRAGVVGSPCASLALPVRLSADAVRQSAEWGPAAMPAPTRLSDGSSHSHGEEQGSPGAAPPPPPPVPAPGGFSPQEQQVIETVTSMLAHDRITPPQAATILQQMLPAASLAALQSRLGVAPEEQGPPRAAYAYGDHAAPRYSDPGLGRRGERAAFGGAYADAGRYSDGSAAAAAAFERERERVEGQGFSLEQLAAMQAAQAMGHHTGSAAAGYGPTRDYAGAGYTYPFAPGSPLSARDASARRSYESARSSMEGSRASTEFATPRGSLDSAPPAPAPPAPTQYATPAAAYPQVNRSPHPPPARPCVVRRRAPPRAAAAARARSRGAGAFPQPSASCRLSRPQEGRGAEGAGVSGAKAPPPPRASPAGKQQRVSRALPGAAPPHPPPTPPPARSPLFLPLPLCSTGPASRCPPSPRAWLWWRRRRPPTPGPAATAAAAWRAPRSA